MASRSGNSLPRKRGRVGVGVYAEHFRNSLQHAGWVLENLVVPKAEDAPPLHT
jgi:hypothetical protein